MVRPCELSNFASKSKPMNSFLKTGTILIVSLVALFVLDSCAEKLEAKTTVSTPESVVIDTTPADPPRPLSSEFKSYWYAGDAEVVSYKLEQARYGEIRDGHAVLVYVTEPFLPEEQVKADRTHSDNISVLKLNSTKKYLTGIYPYSIMTSVFYPVGDNQHALKVSNSVQEWCGHVYSQLNNREEFEVMSHSYFEGEADQEFNFPKAWLENEIWTKIRINPAELPSGEIEMVPSLEYIRTGHKPLKAYKAKATMSQDGDLSTYTIEYPELSRSLSIQYATAFPYSIEGWTESFKSGFGANAKTLTSRASKIETLKTPYWRQNGTEDEILRKELGL